MRSISLGPLLPNVGLFHVVYSTVQEKRGSVTLSFTACRDMLPDPGFYADCLQASFEELREAAAGQKAVAKKKPVIGKKAVTKSKPRKKAR